MIKMARHTSSILLAALLGVPSAPALAHHSFALFDTTRTVTITGTVADFVWANPHSWIYVMVKRSNGTVQKWALECSSPNMMIRWGWHYSDINPGDKISIDVHPNREGKPQGSVYAVFLADGRVLADPMGRPNVSGDELAQGPGAVPTKPTGVPLP